MASFDRKYWKDPGGSETGGSSLTIGMPRPGRMVKTLLLLNVGIYIIQLIADQHMALTNAFGVTVAGWWQIWRYFTCQFMHDVGDPWHIILNMLGLYMLGTPLEQIWGAKRFVIFYLGCGVVAGLAYVILGALGRLDPFMPAIGASGAVFGVIMACAILFPHFQLILIFFPLPIRLAAVLIFGAMIFKVVRAFAIGAAVAAMGDVAHLGGAVAAAVWVLMGPRLHESWKFSRQRVKQGAWERKMAQKRNQQEEIDRILQKIHDSGIGSLTSGEKKILQNASREQQREDREVRRM